MSAACAKCQHPRHLHTGANSAGVCSYLGCFCRAFTTEDVVYCMTANCKGRVRLGQRYCDACAASLQRVGELVKRRVAPEKDLVLPEPKRQLPERYRQGKMTYLPRTVYFDPEWYARLETVADETGRSLSHLVRLGVRMVVRSYARKKASK